MHLSIDHPYLALIHLNWLYQHVPHQLQGLHEASELEVYLNRVTQEAQQRINALMNQGGIALVDAQKQVTDKLLAKTKDQLTSEELAGYHELDLLQLTPEQKTIYGEVYRKIERWYREVRRAWPLRDQAYFRDWGGYQYTNARYRWGWGKNNGQLVEMLGIDRVNKLILGEQTELTFVVTLVKDYLVVPRPPIFAIYGVFVKPIDFFEAQMKLECLRSFWVKLAGKVYRFREGDCFVIGQRSLEGFQW